MVTSFWGSLKVQLTYPLFIALTALARLIILQKKDVSSASLLYEGGAILLIAIAILFLRLRRSKILKIDASKDDI
jgi:protein PsiE